MYGALDFCDIYVELMKRRGALEALGLRADMEWTENYLQDVITVRREINARHYAFRIERDAWQRGQVFALGRGGDSAWYPFRVNPENGQPASMAPNSWTVPPEDLQQFAQQVYGLLVEIHRQMTHSYSQWIQATWRGG